MFSHHMQRNTFDCGIAVLKTVIEQNKINHTNIEFDAGKINVQQGLSLHDIIVILSKYGLRAVAYEITDIKHLEANASYPFIAV